MPASAGKKKNDVICVRRGKDGLHQVSNRTDSPIRIIMISTLIAPDMVHHLDTRKFFFFNDTATTEIYTLSLHDALPISCASRCSPRATRERSTCGFACT